MITAKVIHDSVSPDGVRLTTYELEYPRFFHSEFMTHRVFSRNSASSRAIPIKVMNEIIQNNPAKPIHWGKNQPGMKAREELDFNNRVLAEHEWNMACQDAIRHSTTLDFLGAHKQIANRITEPFQHMKVIMTTTETANWDWLRNHEDAQPEIRQLAIEMLAAREASTPMEIYDGEWHLPYIDRRRIDGKLEYYTLDGVPVGLDDAKQISGSCCAQVSYRKLDDTLEKAKKIYAQLIESEPCHASPVEHQATPIVLRKFVIAESTYQVNRTHINQEKEPVLYKYRKMINIPHLFHSWEDGITHCDRDLNLWSGNFRGWIQNRQLIPNNAKR